MHTREGCGEDSVKLRYSETMQLSRLGAAVFGEWWTSVRGNGKGWV